ncbi:porin [Azospirillum sp. TSO22-1]|uniref:porin n=1 Tax=Azospirillum sp. TSO22-1 TaxID=716789 RepID=UPI0018EE81D3|nr:porin [Azospirillum sp. TSO22-1]
MRLASTLRVAAAVAACATPAAAESSFDLIFGGDAYFQGAYVNQRNDAGLRSTEFANRLRVTMTPTAKADNGLEYGARLRMVTDTGDPSISSRTLFNDRAFLFANGAFGTVQAGTINGLSDEYGIIGPNVEGVAGSPDSNGLLFLNGSSTLGALPLTATSLRTLLAYDVGTKLIYITPSFGGVQGAVSYTPRTNDSNNSVNRRKADPLGAAPTFHDVVEAGAVYQDTFGEVGLSASAFYQTGRANRQTDGVLAQSFEDLRSFHVGANLSYGDAKIGASFANSGKSGYATDATEKRTQTTLILGAQYTMGPFLLAANYVRAQGNDSATMSTPSKADIWQGGITWTVAPGLTTGLEYDYVRSALSSGPLTAAGVAPDDRAHILMLDTRLAF